MQTQELEKQLIEIFKRRSGLDFTQKQNLKCKYVFSEEINLPPENWFIY